MTYVYSVPFYGYKTVEIQAKSREEAEAVLADLVSFEGSIETLQFDTPEFLTSY